VEIVRPAGQRPIGLVIAPDIFGLRPLYDDLVQRLATEWQVAMCAVEPFPGRQLGPEVEPRFAIVPELDDDDHLRDLEQAADLTGAPNVGLLGFCLGGMYCLKAARGDRFSRIASFYGMIRLPESWRSPTQGEPLELLSASTAHPDRVLALIGDRDSYTPPDDVVALSAVGVTVVRYPDAEHGFAHDPDRPAHRPDDAADAFSRAKGWLVG